MKHSIWAGWLVAVALAAASPVLGQRFDGSYLRDVTTKVVSPHLDWATPLAGGAIKATFIAPRNLGAREIVEAAERMSLDYQAVAIYHAAALIRQSVYEAAVTGTSLQEKTDELIDKLKKPADVIVLANVNFDVLPAEAQYRIVQRVADGGGLVLTYSRKFPLKKLLSHPTDDGRTIAAGVDFAELPEPLRKIEPDKLVKTYTFGKGRIVWLLYPGAPSAVYGGPALSVTEPYGTQWKDHYENNLALVLRAIHWAAGRTSGGSLAAPLLGDQDQFSAEELASKGFDLHLKGSATSMKVAARIRDRWNRVVWRNQASAHGASVHLQPPSLPAGRYTLDVRLLGAQGVEDFGYDGFTITSPLGQVALSTKGESFEKNDPIQATVKVDHAENAALTARFRLADSPYGRVWLQQTETLPAGQTSATFTLKPPPMPTIAGVLWCDLMKGDQVIATAQEALFFPNRNIETYPKILWGGIPGTMPELYAARVVDNRGWHAGLSHPDGGENTRRAALLDQRFVPYMTRIGLAADGKGWTQTQYFLGMDMKKVKKELGEDQSFYNPAVQAMWKKDIDLRIKNLPQYGPFVYALGDENHFSYDAGYSPSDQKAFSQFMKERYGTIDKLNEQWGAHFTGFEQVRQPTPAELRKQKNYPAWFDHRLFMEKQYADVHHFLADYIKTIDPHALVGAEGSVPGNLEMTLNGLDFWGPYGDVVMNELLRSLAPDMIRTNWWGGYTSHGGQRDGYPTKQWRWLLQGVINGDSWYNGAIAADGFLGIDFRYADYYRKEIPFLDALDQGQAQLLIDQPLKQDGIALLWSHASYSASFMDNRFVSPKDGASALLNVAYHRGLTVDLVTPSMLAKGALSKYRVLLLPGASALSPTDCRIITDFAEKGGVVIADLNPAVLNQHCKPLDRSELGALFGAEALNWKPELVLKPVSIDTAAAGPSIRFQAAKVWQSPEVQPFTVHKQGKGLAILLNMNLGSANDTASQQTPFEPFILKLLSLGDVKPAVTVQGVRQDHMMLRLRQKGDCLTIGLLVDTADVGKTATLHLPKSLSVYRADGKQVGQGQAVQVKITAPFQLFCAFSQEPSAPALKLQNSQVALGQAVTIAPDGLSADGVYRLELTGPDGKVLRRRTRVIEGRGDAQQRLIRLAYNDAPGQYTITLTDVRTGLSAQAHVQAK